MPLLAGRADAAQDDEDSTSDGAEKDGDPVLDPGPGSGGGGVASGHWDPFVEFVSTGSWDLSADFTIAYPGDFDVDIDVCKSFDGGKVCLKRLDSPLKYSKPECDGYVPKLYWAEHSFTEEEEIDEDGTLEVTAEGTIWIGINKETKCAWAGSQEKGTCKKLNCPPFDWRVEHYIDDPDFRQYYREIVDEIVDVLPDWFDDVALIGVATTVVGASVKASAAFSSISGGAAGAVSADTDFRSTPSE